jgi:hypothetical protein
MNLKIIHRRSGAGCIQFPRTIVAPDAWKVEEFQLLVGLSLRVGDGLHGFRIYSRVPHHCFERVIRVCLVKSIESCYEPTRRRGLE